MMQSMNRFWRAGWCVASALVALAGCGGDEDSAPPDRVLVQAYLMDGTATGTWRSVEVEVAWPGAAPRKACNLYQSGMGLPLPTIPYDVPFTTSARFYSTADCSDAPVASGSSVEHIVLESDTTARLIFVPIMPVGQFVRTTRVEQTGSAITTLPSKPSANRVGASYTVLPDGRVVVIGGARLKDPEGDGLFDNPGEPKRVWDVLDNIAEIYDTVEIFDPSTGVWEVLDTAETSPQTLFYRRAFHRAVFLPSLNLVAVVGGYQQLQVGQKIEGSVAIEVFDPLLKMFLHVETVGPMTYPRVGHSVDVLTYQAASGAIDYLLIAGGRSDVSPQSTGSFEIRSIAKEDPDPTKSNLMDAGVFPNGRWGHETVMAKRSDGKRQIFVVAGETDAGLTPVIDIFEVDRERPGFLEIPGAAAPAGLSGGGRVGHSVVYAAPGTGSLVSGVYIIGGYSEKDRKSTINRIEVLSRDNGAELAPPELNFNLNARRANAGVALLTTGHILVTGGLTFSDNKWRMVQSAEVIGPVQVSPDKSEIQARQTSSLITNRFNHAAVGLPNGMGLVVGGLIKLDDNVRMLGANAVDQGSEVILFQ